MEIRILWAFAPELVQATKRLREIEAKLAPAIEYARRPWFKWST